MQPIQRQCVRTGWVAVLAAAALFATSPARGQDAGAIVAWGDYLGDPPAPNSGFVDVAAGALHSLGLTANGTIVAWGNNEYGECDVPAPNMGFVAIATCGNHSLGLKADGSIVAWGHNPYGQCDVPAPNGDYVAVAAGWEHSLGPKGTRGDLNADGSLDAGDYQLFRAAFGHCRPDIAYRPMMDYDLDGCITLADYQTWLQYYHSANDGAQIAAPLPVSDLNCDGVISYGDINPFVALPMRE